MAAAFCILAFGSFTTFDSAAVIASARVRFAAHFASCRATCVFGRCRSASCFALSLACLFPPLLLADFSLWTVGGRISLNGLHL